MRSWGCNRLSFWPLKAAFYKYIILGLSCPKMTCSHFLPVREWKSRSNSFSISSCLVRASLRVSLYRSSASLSSSVTTQSIADLPFFLMAIPAAIFLGGDYILWWNFLSALCWFSISHLFLSSFLLCSQFHYFFSYAHMWQYFPGMTKPLMVVSFILP